MLFKMPFMIRFLCLNFNNMEWACYCYLCDDNDDGSVPHKIVCRRRDLLDGLVPIHTVVVFVSRLIY